MGISRATEYSIRSLVYMAMNYNIEVITKSELCQTQEVTPGFLTKIMQPLIKCGMVKSFRGAKGGFQLAKDPKTITVYDILESVENVTILNGCLVEEGSCSRDKTCYMHTIWEEAMDSARSVLKNYTLAEIARQQVLMLSMMASRATTK